MEDVIKIEFENKNSLLPEKRSKQLLLAAFLFGQSKTNRTKMKNNWELDERKGRKRKRMEKKKKNGEKKLT